MHNRNWRITHNQNTQKMQEEQLILKPNDLIKVFSFNLGGSGSLKYGLKAHFSAFKLFNRAQKNLCASPNQ